MDSFGKVWKRECFNFWLSHLITYHIYLPVVTPILSNETWCDRNKKKWKNHIVTHWNRDDARTMPRCTNKWSTPNKAWSHHGKTASLSIAKGMYAATTLSIPSVSGTQWSQSAHGSRPHLPRKNVRKHSASDTLFNSSDVTPQAHCYSALHDAQQIIYTTSVSQLTIQNLIPMLTAVLLLRTDQNWVADGYPTPIKIN